MTTRAEVVAYARTLISTPYLHQGRLTWVGLDCIGIPIVTAWHFGMKPRTWDITGYPRSPDGVSVMKQAREHMTEITADEAQPGDVMVITFDRDPQHFGILGDYRHGGLSIIHAAGNIKPARVIETRLMFSRTLRFAAAFRLPGVV